MSASQRDPEELLRELLAAQVFSQEPRKALQLLSVLLKQRQTLLPTLDLIPFHSKLSHSLHDTNPFRDPDESVALVTDTAQRIKQTYRSLADFIPIKSEPALFTTDTKEYISHKYLHDFVSKFALPVESYGDHKPVVCIALPNGPLLAAVCLAVTTHYIAAPINPAAGPLQFQADILQAGANCILTTREHYAKLELEGGWVQENGIQVLLVDLSEDVRISITTTADVPLSSGSPAPVNTADDIALILFTSGTSGTKKVVPITIHSIVVGVAFVIDSWALTAEDICLNMMPLYHM